MGGREGIMSKIGNVDCIFCKIIKGEIPAVKLWEDEKYLAFLDMNQINPGHTLLIPKKHDDYLFDLNDKEYTELMLKTKDMAKILKEKLKSKRIGIIVNGFEIPHVHIHVIPLNNPNEIDPKRAKFTNEEELKKLAEKITK
jgi:histidine triad (HIT) family protein